MGTVRKREVTCAHVTEPPTPREDAASVRMVVIEQLEDAVADAGATPGDGQEKLQALRLDERTPDAATPVDAPLAPGDACDTDTEFQDAADVRCASLPDCRSGSVAWHTLY